jgi:carboxyl-terminal processing protease
MEWMARGAVLAVALLTVAGCGGGGGGGSSLGGRTPSSSSSYTAGQFKQSSTLANQCQAPRAGTTDRSGTTFAENMFLRSWTNETYLWYSEVPDTNPGTSSTDTYFRQLKTPLNTASGRAKDRFHFTYTTEEWEQLSQSGIEVGYGADWLIIAGQPPRRVVVAYTEPGSPAATQAIPRGAEVLFADGVDVVSAGSSSAVDQINAAFFPATAGESHTFIIRDVLGNQRTVTMSSIAVTHTPVLLSTTFDQSGDTIGYILFNDHIATAESQLISAITNLRNAGIDDLILDIRYNGGGYLDIASELGYMIAGPTNIGGRPFERLVFNDKNPSTNPITGQALTPTPFHTTAQGFSTTRGTALPTLNLPRVYVITSSNTCSASESIINSLRGVGVQVFQIGSTTCGKPYGFYPQDNCGTTYFSIQFEGRNADNFGTYPDGFTPQNSPDVGSVDLNGCSVADDFTRALGDPLERRLAAALSFRASGNLSCPAASGLAPDVPLSSKPSMSSTDGVMIKSPARENRIVERPRTGIAF